MYKLVGYSMQQGAGLSVSSGPAFWLSVSVTGEDGGSVTFKDYQTQGVPRIEFNDGRVLDASSTIAYAGGDPDAYVANDTVNNPATDDVA